MTQRVVVQFVIRMMRCRVSAPGNGIYANEGMVMPFVGTVFIVVEHRFNGLHLTGFHRIRKQFFYVAVGTLCRLFFCQKSTFGRK